MESGNVPLVVALTGAAEAGVEQVVAQHLAEYPGKLSLPVSQDPCHRQLGVVVEHALGHPSEEGEGPVVAVTEGFGGLRGIGLDVVGVAVGQVHHQVVGFTQRPIYDHLGLAEVGLAMPWRMHQGHEHLPGGELALAHVVLDYGVLTTEPMFLFQALEYPLGRVTLLLGSVLVRPEDLVDDGGVGV